MDEEKLQTILDRIAEETTYLGPWQVLIQRGPDAEWFVVIIVADTRKAVQTAWKLASLSSDDATIRVKQLDGNYIAQVFTGFRLY